MRSRISYFLAHNAAVTCSVFAPKPNLILEQLQLQELEPTVLESDSSLSCDKTILDSKTQPSPNKVIWFWNVLARYLILRQLIKYTLNVLKHNSFNCQGFASGTFPKSVKETSKKDSNGGSTNTSISGYVLISGDYDGGMNVFLNVLKGKHSSLPSASSVSVSSN